MTMVLMMFALLLIGACNALFFYLGFVTGGKKPLRPYVLVTIVLMVLGITVLVTMRGPGEALTLSVLISWMAGVGAGELRQWLKADRGGKR
jgi:hypothetical protein